MNGDALLCEAPPPPDDERRRTFDAFPSTRPSLPVLLQRTLIVVVLLISLYYILLGHVRPSAPWGTGRALLRPLCGTYQNSSGSNICQNTYPRIISGARARWSTLSADFAARAAEQQESDSQSDEHLLLLIAIMSAPTAEGARRRAAVRKTWLRLLPEQHWSYVFIVGAGSAPENETAALMHEAALYGDVAVLCGVADTYERLTRKTFLTLEWLLEYACVEAAYVAKCDDDAYVRVDWLVPRLQSAGGALRDAVWAHVTPDFHPHVDIESKWFMSSRERRRWGHLFDEHSAGLAYPHGPFYMMHASSVLPRLVHHGVDEQVLDFPWEDVAVGIALRRAYADRVRVIDLPSGSFADAARLLGASNADNETRGVTLLNTHRVWLWCDFDVNGGLAWDGEYEKIVYHHCSPEEMRTLHRFRPLRIDQ